MPAATTDVDKYLETLGLSLEDLNEDAVRAAYKKLALRWHPDRHNADPEEAKQKFIEVNEAYRALVEACKKKKYRRKKPRKDTDASSSHWQFWASSNPSTSSASSSQASCGAEHTTKHSDSRKAESSSHTAHADKKQTRTSDRRDKPTAAAPKSKFAYPRFKPSSNPESTQSSSNREHHRERRHPHHHHNRDTDSDSSSDAGSVHAHDHFRSPCAKAKQKAPLGEDDYEFIDLGTPLKPLRSPRSFSASTKDWIFPLHLTLEDLYYGAVHRYRITRTLNATPATHPHSRSTSHSVPASEGARRQTVQIDVHVSPGWTTGTRIRVPRVGNQRADGSFQDIVFVVAESPHPRFIRRGDDLILPVRVPWVDAHTRPYPPGHLGGEDASPFDLWHGESAESGRYRLGAGAFHQVRFRQEVQGYPALAHGAPREDEDEVYVLGINGEEYTIPIPRTLVEAADGTRIYGAGMPVRKNGCVVGMSDMIIRWEFVFPESAKLQRSRWQTLKDAMHIKLPAL
ncbi:hypothetical protein C8Q73DRAFT_18053 [Cubamyces lactineus]|nr:hypothetical protein C8Q73DRAFT_18053 [Cubamyces lactineus]